MTSEVLTAMLALIGTCVGSLGGIVASNKLTMYRIQQLEKKVEKHNSLVERMTVVEQRSKSNTHRLNEIEEREHERQSHRIDDIEAREH